MLFPGDTRRYQCRIPEIRLMCICCIKPLSRCSTGAGREERAEVSVLLCP